MESKKAHLTTSFTMTQWHGEEYEYDENDFDIFQEGEIVEVLKEVTPNPMGRMFAIYSPRLNESTVISEVYLKFIN